MDHFPFPIDLPTALAMAGDAYYGAVAVVAVLRAAAGTTTWGFVARRAVWATWAAVSLMVIASGHPGAARVLAVGFGALPYVGLALKTMGKKAVVQSRR